MRARDYLRLVVACSALAGLTACGAGGPEDIPMGLATAVVERRDLVSSVSATGTVEPILVIDVKSQASGEVLELAVELGDRVAQGDLLVRIDPRDVRNAHEQAAADLEVARARLSIAERQLERVQSLHDSAIVTDDELEGAVLEHANARAELVKAQTNLELAADRLNDVTVRAPISGVIVEKNVEQGQIVTSMREVTGGTTLVRMADLAEVQVRTLVDETDIGKVQSGLPASIRVEAFPEREFNGAVLKIEPQAVVEQNVTMFAVLTRIQNEQDLLKPGMNADVEVVVGRSDGVLALPNGAIKTRDEARQLAEVLGLEVPEEGRNPVPSGRPPAEGAAAGSALAQGSEDPQQRLRDMSPEERRRAFENMSPAERRRFMEQARTAREGEAAADRENPARARPAYVFRYDDEGRLELVPVEIGLGTWEFTEILHGLEEGEEVVMVPQGLIQQREMLERFRQRTGLPGVRREEGR